MRACVRARVCVRVCVCVWVCVFGGAGGTKGNELLAIFDVTRDKDDTRRAEEYFKSACKLDPSVAEEADEGRQQAIAKRRSRRQRAANSAAERRRSVVEGVSAHEAHCLVDC